MDPSVLEIAGAQAPNEKYTSLATLKFIGGMQSQRSPFASLDTRYNSKYLGGRPDALIAGSNVELSNKLTLQRRCGLLTYGTASIPPPDFFYEWKKSAPPELALVVDTASAIYNYSPTFAGNYFNKSVGAGQTSFQSVVNTLYFGDGVDLYKIIGPNLLSFSNTFNTGAPWTSNNATFVTGQSDPVGGTNATQVTWTAPGSLTRLVQSSIVPNYTPIANNTFTFSIWMKLATASACTVAMVLQDQSVGIANQVISLTSTWTRYQVTGTAFNSSTSLSVAIFNPTTAVAIDVYGAQLEVGGPTTLNKITTTTPQGVYLWGIQAPTTAPVIQSLGSVGQPPAWQATFNYSLGDEILDPNGYVQTASVAGTSGGTIPTFSMTVGATTPDASTLVWTNSGPGGPIATMGFQYYYAFMNSVTGHVSNVSPISFSTGPNPGLWVSLTGIGMQRTPSGPYNQDPQVDTIVIYRNLDQGAFWYQIASFPNPGNATMAGTWEFVDKATDDGTPVVTQYRLNGGSSLFVTERLNTAIFAPVGLLNTPPPVGLTNLAYNAGRMWGSVGSLLYYNTAADNAAAINVTQNGVPSESWAPANIQPFDTQIVRSLPTAIGLLVFTFSDIWNEAGTNLATFNPTNIFPGHGIRSYNALAVDGSSILIYTSDRENLMINPSSGSVEVGFPIGDLLEDNVSPLTVYIARHISGSRDNAFYVADGVTGWFRLNPNQTGASASGEQTPVWSPFATISNGCGAIASIETSPGIHQLLVGQTVTGPVLVRNINTFTDNGTAYPWSATIGSIMLATPGKLAETESITTELDNSSAAQPSVGVLLDEIAGTFEVLPSIKPGMVNDPPQLPPSSSVLSNRFWLSAGTLPPICRHMQIQLSGAPGSTKDELLALTVRGALVPEQA